MGVNSGSSYFGNKLLDFLSLSLSEGLNLPVAIVHMHPIDRKSTFTEKSSHRNAKGKIDERVPEGKINHKRPYSGPGPK